MNSHDELIGAEGKTIFLIRHAESTNNVSKRIAAETLGSLKWPSLQDWKTMAPMITFPMNTELSEEGQKQVERQADILLKDGFVARERPELIVHSPLLRAKATCMNIFSRYDVPIQEHPELYETSLGEHFAQHTGIGSKITPRLDNFTSWLQQREESVIVVVGHSGFFRKLVRPEKHLDNISVWRATLRPGGKYHDVKIEYEGFNGR